MNRDVASSYKSQYRSFELKKKLKDFESNCLKRDEISNYSLFNIKPYKDPKIGKYHKAIEEHEEF